MIDLHSHILPKLDDGARTLEDSRALARLAAADGVTAIAATPHVRDDYPTRAEQMERLVSKLRRDFAEQRIPVEVLHGGEIDLRMVAALDVEELRRFTISQNGRYLLLEFPYHGWPLAFEERLFDLQVQGMTPIIAHPERNRRVQADPDALRNAVRSGALVQVTAASLDGRLGRSARDSARGLVERRLAHLLASDAHTPQIRAAGLSSAVEALADDAVAHYLTVAAPQAIVAGEPVPSPPSGRRRKRFFVL